MTDLDDTLRESLGRLAEPGDTAGVADAVAAKAAALGSAGGAAGGGAAGFSAWVVPAVVGLVAIGGGVWANQAWGADAGGTDAVFVALPGNGAIPAAACPGGASTTQLDPGARVLAVQRTDDGAYLAVRDPGALGSVVWVSAGYAIPDESVSALPVGGCDEATSPIPSASPSVTPSPSSSAEPSAEPSETTKPEPKPTETDEPEPEPEPEPEKPKDTKKPTFSNGSWNVARLCTPEVGGDGPFVAKYTVTVRDNVKVKSVTATSTAPGIEISGPTKSGSKYTFTVQRHGVDDVTVVLKVTAKDTSNNTQSHNSPGLESSSSNCFG
ncbi:hypothetical protein [Demequina sp.]|uniref:hypothetical protein n=1 Tax=Demequina sp. TaxID=2050685 RepID=UPI003D11F3F9